MKQILLLVITCTISTALFAQYDYDTSSGYPFGLPNPEAPSEIKDYESMIGISDCLSTSRNQDGTWADPIEMQWEYKYIMNGMAVQDQVLRANGLHAGSIRQYNADSTIWYVHYYTTANSPPQLSAWKGGNKGNDILLYKKQNAPNGTEGFYKITFHDITAESFNWKGEWVNVGESIIFPNRKIECNKRGG